MRLYQRVAKEDARPVEAAWFLEFSRQYFSGDVYKPPKLAEITKILDDQRVAERSAQLVASDLVAFADFPTYWRDTFNVLGIQSVPIPALAEP